MKEPMKNHLAPGAHVHPRRHLKPLRSTVSSSDVSVVDLRVQPARGRPGLRGRELRAPQEHRRRRHLEPAERSSEHSVPVGIRPPTIFGHGSPEHFEDLFHRFGGGHGRSSPARMQAPPGPSRPLSACNPPIWLWTSRARRSTSRRRTTPRHYASLYKSTNTGASWTQTHLTRHRVGTIRQPRWTDIFADPTVSGTVYVLSDNGSYFFKSTDFGSTWTEIAQKRHKVAFLRRSAQLLDLV